MGHIGGARLSGLDTAFLCLESAQAPMHLGGWAVFHPARPVPPDQLLAVVCDRAERLPRLRWRVSRSMVLPTPATWVHDRRFDVRRHVHLHRLPEGDHDSAARFAARLMAEPLDLYRPPWQLHVVTGLTDGRFGVLLKLHHALADGLRALEVGVGLLDGFEALSQSPAAPEPSTAAAGPPGSLVDRVAGVVAALPELAREAADSAGIVASVLSRLRVNTAGSPLAVPPAGPPAPRRLALVRLEIDGVRRVRGHHGGTTNDVLLAVLAGAVHDWLTGRGYDRLDELDLRVLVPVSRRHRPDGGPGTGLASGGNVLSGYLCPLPVQEPDPVARLQSVRNAMGRNKAAGPARGPGAFPLLADRLPAVLHRIATPLTRHSAGRLFDAVVTNVPIPSLPLSLAGAPLSELYPIAPLAHGQALGVALSTYRDAVYIGLYADAAALPDLDRLADALPAALTALVKTTDEA